MNPIRAVKVGARRLLRQLARPVRQDAGGEGLVVEAYRGYGHRREIYLMGRVLRQPGGTGPTPQGDLLAALRRLFRRGAPKQTVTARFAGTEQQVVSDSAGYFRVHLHLPEPLPAYPQWRPVALRLALPSGAVAEGTAEIFVPPPEARFVVISDIDDTVMYTGVAQKLRMLWRLFALGPESRTAFPGVAALYRALHGPEQNPMLYVSRGPWTIYSMLEAFFQHHDIPVGPVLFLRDWGLTPTRLLPRSAPEHKLELIRSMLSLYRDLPFVLIGDSGQHDPETYARVVREYPGRVAAVYIRNVSRNPARVTAIEALAKEVLAQGSSLLLAADSVAMAEDAAERGLVQASAVTEVASESRLEGGGRRRLAALESGSRREAEHDVEEGRLAGALEGAEDEPPNTLIESRDGTHPRRRERARRDRTR